MINVFDNRTTPERRLGEIEAGKFFMINGILYRRCWWDINSFNKITYEEDCLVCTRIDDGELVVLRHDHWVEPVADKQIELRLED